MRWVLLIGIIMLFKAGKAVNRFDISENIGHSHKQQKRYEKHLD